MLEKWNFKKPMSQKKTLKGNLLHKKVVEIQFTVPVSWENARLGTTNGKKVLNKLVNLDTPNRM